MGRKKLSLSKRVYNEVRKQLRENFCSRKKKCVKKNK